MASTLHEVVASTSVLTDPAEYTLVRLTETSERGWEEPEKLGWSGLSRLSLEDFHSHEAPTLQLSNVFICLMLRLFFPFSGFAVLLMLKLGWLKPIWASEQMTLWEQAWRMFDFYGASEGVATPFILALNLAYYMISTWYRSTGPLCAVLLPWVLSFSTVPVKVARAASASDNPQRVKLRQFLQLIMIVERQLGVPHDALCCHNLDGTEDCFRLALETVFSESEDFTVREGFFPCRPSRTVSEKTLIALHHDPICEITVRSSSGDLVASSRWVKRWPPSDRFLEQQERMNGLMHFSLLARPADEASIPQALLPAYQRSLQDGDVNAADFASQMSIGFATQTPAWVSVMWGSAAGAATLVLIGSCILVWWMPEWHHGVWYHQVMLTLFVGYGILDGAVFTMFQLAICAQAWLARLTDLKVLNATLAGPIAAQNMFVPAIRIHVPSDLLVWGEVRELCLARYAAEQLEMDVSVVVASMSTLGMALGSIYSSLQEQWEPGLFSFVSVLSMTLYIIFGVPLFVIGILVNMENAKSLDLMSQHSLQAQFALSHPGLSSSAEEREQIQESLSFANLLVQHLRINSGADVRVLGMKLTPSTASALVSGVSAALAFTLRSLPVDEMKEKLFASKAWDALF
ncbi:unnamed protein product [Durusdinium trenchii]|uniref:Solute carrier family 40 protein n=1 Tax=Durusdinium trenchii TaxID=1381693 RepID=A0ABP0JIS4_9DINO